jgi:hypothetical protein
MDPAKRRIVFLGLVLAWLFPGVLIHCGSSANHNTTGTGSGTGTPPSTAPLSAGNVNLIFVVSDDLAYQGSGDVNPTTANLTGQGLQRSLLMAKFLERQVLGSNNVTSIYALEPITHLQTTNNYPDIVALWAIQQFALLNQITLSTVAGSYATPYSANSYPLNASYASGSVPTGVVTPSAFCSSCQGIDFNDEGGDNEALVSAILNANAPGFYVFSAPWETVGSLLAKINNLKSYNLNVPTSYQGPNYIYAISVTPSGSSSLVTYNSGVQPSSAYPVLPAPVPSSACTEQVAFSITVTEGSSGAVIPPGINTNETLYMIRHAEAHPQGSWDDGNYVGAGQWRALDLPNALQGKISPTQVYSIDPAQFIGGTQDVAGNAEWSYVRPSLTVEPYAIANNLPYNLAANFAIFSPHGPASASNFFFTGGRFSNQKVLLAWEHTNIPATMNALIASYFPSGGAPVAPSWPSGDYDTIWTATLDSQANLSVNNASCEGIDSSALPATAPQF